jgi:hypothetical protein
VAPLRGSALVAGPGPGAMAGAIDTARPRPHAQSQARVLLARPAALAPWDAKLLAVDCNETDAPTPAPTPSPADGPSRPGPPSSGGPGPEPPSPDPGGPPNGESSNTTANTSTPAAALLSVFEATPATWSRSDSWGNTSVSVCEWYGVTCDECFRVVGLNLADNRISRTVRLDRLVQFRRLERLILRGNNIRASELTPLYQLTRLTELDLTNTFVSGSLSAAATAWTALERIATGPGVSGTLLPQFSRWTRIKSLQFTGARLSGSLLLSYTAWTALETLVRQAPAATGCSRATASVRRILPGRKSVALCPPSSHLGRAFAP